MPYWFSRRRNPNTELVTPHFEQRPHRKHRRPALALASFFRNSSIQLFQIAKIRRFYSTFGGGFGTLFRDLIILTVGLDKRPPACPYSVFPVVFLPAKVSSRL